MLKQKEEDIKEQKEKFDEELKKATKELLKQEKQKLQEELKKEILEEQSESIALLKKELDEKSNQVKELNTAKAYQILYLIIQKWHNISNNKI